MFFSGQDFKLSQESPLLSNAHPFPGNNDPLDLSSALVDLVEDLG